MSNESKAAVVGGVDMQELCVLKADLLAAQDCTSMEQIDALAEKIAARLPRPTDDELWDATLRDRDTYHEWADKLAEGIAKHFGIEIGEHSNQNLPWAEALEHIEAISAAPVSGPSRAEFIQRVLLSVAEIPDRNSPEDRPEMMLVSGAELKGILLSAFEHEDEAAPVSGQGASDERVPGIGHPTTFAELGSITPLQLWNRWRSNDRDISARDAFIAARALPFIDSRPRSEDSRAKVEVAILTSLRDSVSEGYENGELMSDKDSYVRRFLEDRIRALASTTPSKADNE